LNRDGHSDLLWQHQTSGLISVWHMNGLRMVDGVVLSPDPFPDPNLKLRAVGDIDGDQWPDLVWQNQATGFLSAWLMHDLQRQDEVRLSPNSVPDTNWRIVGMRFPWDYSGIYTLTITTRSCTPGFPEVAKRRVYTARVEQTAANFRVSLSGGDFLRDSYPSGGTFDGAVTPTGGVGFFLGSSWDAPIGLEERLSDGTTLMIFGTIGATGTRAGIFSTPHWQGIGEIYHFPPHGSSWSFWDFTGWCYLDRFDMVPQ
jgi:hypothetical protein